MTTFLQQRKPRKHRTKVADLQKVYSAKVVWQQWTQQQILTYLQMNQLKVIKTVKTIFLETFFRTIRSCKESRKWKTSSFRQLTNQGCRAALGSCTFILEFINSKCLLPNSTINQLK